MERYFSSISPTHFAFSSNWLRTKQPFEKVQILNPTRHPRPYREILSRSTRFVGPSHFLDLDLLQVGHWKCWRNPRVFAHRKSTEESPSEYSNSWNNSLNQPQGQIISEVSWRLHFIYRGQDIRRISWGQTCVYFYKPLGTEEDRISRSKLN